jgi:quinol-cytochrome oxidoreductase complex cytochrome b subunit
VSGATLTRFYALHVSVLPGLAFLLIALHVLLVQKHGMSVPPGIEAQKKPLRSIPIFPNFLLRDFVGWLSALTILAAMAAFAPAELGEKADPFAPAPAGIRPEWYFMFMFQTLKYLPPEIIGIEGELVGIAAFGLAALVLVFIPFIDRHGQGRSSRALTWAAYGALAYIIVLTILGYTASPEG